mgnify:CR=1 FL=1
MKLKLIILFALFCGLTVYKVKGQSVLGKWKTYDIFDSSIEESVVDIYEFENQLFVKIVKIIPKEHVNDLCVNCKGKEKNQPVLGMIILEGAVFHQGFWQGAQILNAKNGKRYGCHLSLEENDLLKVRGFIGYPIFGKTLFWTRVKDHE